MTHPATNLYYVPSLCSNSTCMHMCPKPTPHICYIPNITSLNQPLHKLPSNPQSLIFNPNLFLIPLGKLLIH